MKDMTSGKEYRTILLFALPLMGGQLLQQFYNIIDSIIVGHFLGKEALAAIGSSFPLIFGLISFMIGIVTGSTIVIAQYFGAKDKVNLKRTIDTMYVSVFIFSLGITLAGWFLSIPVFKWIGLPEELIPFARTYFIIFVSGIPLMFGFNGTNAVLRGLGDSKTPLYFVILVTLLNGILDVIFVLILKLGIAGVSLATVMAQGAGFVYSMIYLNRRHKVFRFSLRSLDYNWDILRKMLRIGIPSGIHQTSVALSMIFLLSIVNPFGTNVIAAYSVGSRLIALAGLPAMVLGTSLSTFTGQNMGARQLRRVRTGFYSTLLMGSAVMLFLALSMGIFSRQLFMIFTHDQQVITIGSGFLSVNSWFLLVFSGMFILNGVMQGAGDTLMPMVFNIFSMWIIRIPSAYFFSSNWGYTAIWWAFPVSWMSGMLLSFFYYLTGRWKRFAVVKHPVGATEVV